MSDISGGGDDLVRVRVRITGTVQGVGFRPAVHRAASGCGLSGLVANDDAGVFVELQGPRVDVEDFVARMPEHAPPRAEIDRVEIASIPLEDDDTFRIAPSRDARAGDPVDLPPDLGPCASCLAELADPTDRRYRYPFLNCTDCGPRFSIITRAPYDRARTSMAAFAPCAACAAEYADPDDRRFHAQANCCAGCGPTLVVRGLGGAGPVTTGPAALADAVDRLRDGQVVAVKGIGGYHLACDAADVDAVGRLRRSKHRGDKPFAVLVADVASARHLCTVTEEDGALLEHPSRPVVLLPSTPDAAVADAVAPGNRMLGVMLPPSPLHALLAGDMDRPLVLTSANRHAEPIVHRDDDLDVRLAGLADAVCTHDRVIHARIDDSVVRPTATDPMVMRRARGYTPRPVNIGGGVPRHVLGCGALLKATAAIGRDHRVIVGPHVGDLDHHLTFVAHEAAIDHLCALFDVHPAVIAHDLHPDFASTDLARKRAEAIGAELLGVQHHHAHIASCTLDNGFAGPVIGVAFDGTGLGDDGTIWGGEILHVDGAVATRLGHLRTVGLPGGDAAVREPWRMAAAHLAAALDADASSTLDVVRRNAERWSSMVQLSRSTLAPATSSMGRLFDAVAALVGVRDLSSYEGQAAIELEQLAGTDDATPFPVALEGDAPFVIDTVPIIRAVADALVSGTEASVIAARFHATVVALVVAACRRAGDREGLATVALSGGAFQNVRLLDGCRRALRAEGFRVLTHRDIPPNDGGISAGQVAVAIARDQRRASSTNT